jgi:SAM-dependent methyltransferase
MIRVLQSWDQVGDALLSVQKRGLPAHESAQKNWDHWLLLQAIEGISKTAPILDLGCGNGFTLKLLATDGFQNLDGIDSHLAMRLRLSRWVWSWRNRTTRRPFRLHRGDFTQMHFLPKHYDLAFSISVIEHGVRLAPFLEECHRVLKPGGLLFVTADYWDPKIATNSANHAFGRAWHIFSKEEIERFLFVAEKVGFHLVERAPIPPTGQPMIHWQTKDYTAISLLLQKTPA